MSEHTPTPWHVNDDRPLDDTSRLSISNGDARIIANIVTRKTTHGFEGGSANAAFIVKAVNNHDALVTALKAAREAIWSGGDTVSAISKIDAVLVGVGGVGT